MILFITRFEGGFQTCTGVFCPPDKLDLRHGLRLADQARRRLAVTTLLLIKKKRAAGEPVDEEVAARIRASLQTAPRIVAAHFENLDGAVLKSYDVGALTAILPRLARTGT